MAKLVRHLTSNEEIVSSNSAEGIIFPVLNRNTFSFCNLFVTQMLQNNFESVNPKIETESLHDNLLYPAWCSDNGASVEIETIRSIFDRTALVFGFQADNSANMFEYLMSLLDSRASRMSCTSALISVHADYLGGDSSSYKKWYFAAYYDLDRQYSDAKDIKRKWNQWPRFSSGVIPNSPEFENDRSSFWGMDYAWRLQMSKYSEEELLEQLVLYLLIWGEANNLRFMPECIFFIYKCASDYLFCQEEKPAAPEFSFLNDIVTPIYLYIRDQQFDLKDGKLCRKRGLDHAQIIGYDDVNSFFWYPSNLEKLRIANDKTLHSIQKEHRYKELRNVQWKTVFQKTYLETRSWGHVIVNFNRIWVIHLSAFWYYFVINTPALYTRNYYHALNTKSAPQVQLTVVALGGSVSCMVSLLSTIGEWFFVPRSSLGCQPLLARFTLQVFLLLALTAPSVYILIFKGWNVYSPMGCAIGGCQLGFSLLTTAYLSATPADKLFSFIKRKADPNTIKTTIFTSSFAKMTSKSALYSLLLWLTVFTSKFLESYFFLTLSLKDPLNILLTMDTSRCAGDIWLKKLICQNFAKICAGLLLLTNFLLFFLDTYLWYIICNCIFSTIIAYSAGTSIFKPWKNRFSKLPERIISKIVFSLNEKDGDFAITKIWNCIVISFYKEHLLSVEQVNKLIYQKETDDDKLAIGGFREPIFFNFQEDSASEKLSDFFASNAEASRRISFFARSLSSSLQAPIPIEGLPSFTVFAPHYSEKIILEIKELLKENEKSKISLLEYLKKLHPSEWRAFVKDTKLSKHVNSLSSLGTDTSWTLAPDEQAECSESRYTKWQNMQKYEDIPFDSIGFKNSEPESTIRTRIWASLRYQTLFRTISGFSNYEKALKILYYSENYNLEREFLVEPADLEDELDAFSRRKFRLLVSMQRYQHLRDEDLVATQLTAECFPNLHISYIEAEETETGTCYYSVLLNSTNERAEESEDIRFRIKLSGDPKLGDGKSDNQNHSIIFHRGEYIQAIDSNQDNYIEECLKIKSVLAEFEELDLDPTFEYVPGMSHVTQKPRVAMVGAREYIFSENIGVLGDVSAGKEQTFGTLFARTLSKVNAKLHYGHPDFINSIFMFSRGGISKAQKGLHLNEDIYAGMNAVGRGGIVKHCDYYQCGKGRDLGFATILNFNTKIGAGMGEQTLSREVFYMGTRLHVDRFLSFYYAHAGFHLNNVFIILSVSLFLVILVFLGSLRYESILCITETASSTVEANIPYGCRNLVPVLEWMNRFVLSMFICFTISFLPITVQEITEKGVLNTLKRVTHHFFSLAPLFEVLVCKVYAKSFTENLRFGGAKYVATGRGFATERVKFHELYSKYADVSIYAGGFGLLVTIFATLTMWRPALFWFYLTSFALCFSPFVFNPHNFCLQEYILDYGFFLGWLFGGNHSSSDDTWVAFKKHQRAKYTGFKSNKRATSDSTIALSESSSSSANKLGEVGTLLFQALLFLLPYLYITAQSGVQEPVSVDPITRIAFLALLPIILNLIMLLILFPVSVVAGNLLTLCFKSSPSLFAGMSYTWGFLGLIICVNVTLLLHDWNVPRSLCAMICIMKIHTFLKTLTYNALLSKEYQDHQSNLAWWSGNWNIKRFGWAVLSQPFREILVKTCDLTSFGYDFVLGHFLFTAIFPVALVPLVDKAHTYILFWLKPSRIVHGPIYSKRQRKRRRRQSVLYSLLYLTVVSCSCAMVVVPAIFLRNFKIGQRAPEVFKPMFQPNHQNNNDTGPAFLASTPGVFALRTVQ
ncbi:hypothetical protein E0198_000732 [Clavispora lusitaniae]|nr:hypothetical protein E0198_000732 [Clavispora lusitaniae]